MTEITKPGLKKQIAGKPVSQCYPGTTIVVKHFSSQREASDSLNIDWSHIAAVARANRSGNAGKKGYRSTAGKFTWYFTEDLDTLEAIKVEKKQYELENTPSKPKITLTISRKQKS